jgi:hypothetical protein
MPSAWAATPSRERSRVAIATLNPWFTSPTTFSGGTRTPAKIGCPVGEPRIPSLCSSLPTLKPGRSASTTNAMIPREWPAARSVTANTT